MIHPVDKHAFANTCALQATAHWLFLSSSWGSLQRKQTLIRGSQWPLSLLCVHLSISHCVSSKVTRQTNTRAWWPGWLCLEWTVVPYRRSLVWECGFTLNFGVNAGDHRSWPVRQFWEQPVSPSSVAEKTCLWLTVKYSQGEICRSSDSSSTWSSGAFFYILILQVIKNGTQFLSLKLSFANSSSSRKAAEVLALC